MAKPLIIICFFTFTIHMTETLAYCMRLAGLRTRQIAISMSFVTSTLLISRLSNMFQAPLLGTMVDGAILSHADQALVHLEWSFRLVILFGFLGSLMGAFLTPTAVYLFERAIRRFLHHGSLPRLFASAFIPRNFIKIIKAFRLPKFASLKRVRLSNLPKTFLIMNVVVTSVYTIGVLCSLLAGAYIPQMRSTANQLSGIVNGMATILLTVFVDPSGARITDQAFHGVRSEEDVRSVVFFMQVTRLLGTLVIAQLFFDPFAKYIMWVTQCLAKLLV
ncbi:MAG: lipid II flippase Amj family protein [Candidatus Margulisiibacteriota bacterium]